MENIYIDTYDLFDTWHITPLDEFFTEMMAFPDIKKRVEMDLAKQDGLDVLLTAGKLDKIEQTLKFGVDTYDNYLAFMDYITSVNSFGITCLTIDSSITVDYLSTTDFEEFKEGITFAIKVREANFKNRTPIYLLTEARWKIMTESGIFIII